MGTLYIIPRCRYLCGSDEKYFKAAEESICDVQIT